MYTISSDADIRDRGVATYIIADLLSAAEHALDTAEIVENPIGRAIHRGRAEAYLLMVPLVLPDYLWARYRSLVERTETLTV